MASAFWIWSLFDRHGLTDMYRSKSASVRPAWIFPHWVQNRRPSVYACPQVLSTPYTPGSPDCHANCVAAVTSTR